MIDLEGFLRRLWSKHLAIEWPWPLTWVVALDKEGRMYVSLRRVREVETVSTCRDYPTAVVVRYR